MCERVGEPCICRLAVALERHTATLAWLSLAGNGLTQLPAALTALPALRYLDLSANGLSALPAGFTDLRSLQVGPCRCAATDFEKPPSSTAAKDVDRAAGAVQSPCQRAKWLLALPEGCIGPHSL